jgi:hypothetical protein
MVWTVNHLRTLAVVKASVRNAFDIDEKTATLFATELVEKMEGEGLISHEVAV